MAISDFPVPISTHELHLFFSSYPLEEGECERGWVDVLQPAKGNPPHFILCEELSCGPHRECQSWSGMAVQWWLPLGSVWTSHPELRVVSHVLFMCSSSTNFHWLLNGFSLVLIFFHHSNSCPNVFTKPHPLLPPVPPEDHFLHLPCKTTRIKFSPCLQSQQTVCMSNQSFPFSPILTMPFVPPFSFDLLLALLCCVRLNLVIGCPGLLHCMVQEAQKSCSWVSEM